MSTKVETQATNDSNSTIKKVEFTYYSCHTKITPENLKKTNTSKHNDGNRNNKTTDRLVGAGVLSRDLECGPSVVALLGGGHVIVQRQPTPVYMGRVPPHVPSQRLLWLALYLEPALL